MPLNADTSAPFAVERFLALQTYLVALPRLLQMPVPDSIKRQFCITCRDIASTPQQPDQRLALESHEFRELAQIATLRRFHAGELSFDVIHRMPFAWLLKAHPFDLPGFLRELCFGMRGVGPMVEPHFNWWRANRIVLLKREHDRAMWRIAQFVKDRSPRSREWPAPHGFSRLKPGKSPRTWVGYASSSLPRMRES